MEERKYKSKFCYRKKRNKKTDIIVIDRQQNSFSQMLSYISASQDLHKLEHHRKEGDKLLVSTLMAFR